MTGKYHTTFETPPKPPFEIGGNDSEEREVKS
jgi:hypothetical protein